MLFEGVTGLIDDGLSQLRHGLVSLGKFKELDESELVLAVEWAAELCAFTEGFLAQVKQHVDTRAESVPKNDELGVVSRRLRDSLGSLAGATQEVRLALVHAVRLKG
jgi:hypothetical protein